LPNAAGSWNYTRRDNKRGGSMSESATPEMSIADAAYFASQCSCRHHPMATGGLRGARILPRVPTEFPSQESHQPMIDERMRSLDGSNRGCAA
jgi:hypothetical protein